MQNGLINVVEYHHTYSAMNIILFFCETSYKTNENVLQSYSVRNILDLSIIDKVQTFKIGIKEKFF